MKNVLFATTALVAFAGAASAQEISWGGEVTTGYNDVIEGGLFLQGELTASATVDLGDNVTAEFAWAGASWDDNALTLSDKITSTITYTNNNMTASLKAGDLGDKGASEYFYSDRSGMSVDVENHDGASDVRALIEFGSFGVAVGCSAVGSVIGTCDGMNVGAGATFGSIELGIGYDDASGTQTATTAVSVDATFGAISVGVSYATGTSTYSAKTGVDGDDADPLALGATTVVSGTETSVGVELGYEISSALSVEVFYASNSVLGAQYGLSASYSAGALGIDVYFENQTAYWLTPAGVDLDGDGFYTAAGTAAFASNNLYGIDISYDVSSQLTVLAGVKIAPEVLGDEVNLGTATGYYAGVEYAVNDNISATVSYANFNEISGPEYKDGISAFITASF